MRARVGNFLQVFRFRIAEVARLRNDDVEITQILNVVTEALQLFIQVCIAQRRRTHVYTAAVGAEIHWHTHNRYFRHTYIVPSGGRR